MPIESVKLWNCESANLLVIKLEKIPEKNYIKYEFFGHFPTFLAWHETRDIDNDAKSK